MFACMRRTGEQGQGRGSWKESATISMAAKETLNDCTDGEAAVDADEPLADPAIRAEMETAAKTSEGMARG